MFPSGIEFIMRERQKAFIQEAEQRRLINMLQRQKLNEPKAYKKVTSWVGFKMVMWGAKLQDYSARSSTIRTIDVEYPPY